MNRLRNRLLVSVFIALCVIWSTQLLWRQYIQLPALYRLESVADNKDIQHVEAALRSMADSVLISAKDNAHWDDAYEYVSNPLGNAEFEESVITVHTLRAQNTEGFVFISRDGSILKGVAWSFEDDSPLPLNPIAMRDMNELVLPTIFSGQQHTQLHGILGSKLGPILMGAAAVLKNDLSGKPNTMLLIWKRINKTTLAQWQEKLVFPIESWAVTEVSKPDLSLAANSGFVRDAQNRVHWLIRDLRNRSSLLTRIQLAERHFDDRLFSLSQVVGIVISLLIMMTLGLAADRGIVRPILHLQRAMDRVVRTGSYHQRVSDQRRDELGNLARDYNKLLDHIQEQEKGLTERNESLEKISEEDALTGILNRRGFDRMFEVVWEDGRTSHTPLGICAIDVDHFKAYNDHYGHPAGDRALKAIANTLEGHLHVANDVAARIGGEEFSILLPNTSTRDVMSVAERLRMAVSNLNMAHEGMGENRKVSICVGVAVAIPGEDSSPQQLLSTADQRLYEAKAAGRNCVVGEPQSVN